MDSQRWDAISELFLRVSEMDPATRGDVLDEACGGDAELRREVEAMLASHDAEESEPLFELSPVRSLLDSAGESDGGDALVGETIGAYEVVRKIGEGGMSRVYLARRTSGYEQEVAIKVLRPGMDTSDLLGRFQQEIELLAALADHPHIAGLYDAGSLDGRPYFVMEYVRGTWITEYCDAKRLSVRARLELFASVCEAVSAAHKHAIIHRDLKPSNILITDEGMPKLIDFGIAKLERARSADATQHWTQAGSTPLTPEYASPEQFSQGAVTTASDVYSLGVVLYELLSGCRPYELRGASIAEIVDAVCEQPITRPSRMLQGLSGERKSSEAARTRIVEGRGQSAEQLARTLTGDLDNIVMKCLEKDRERRYGSVDALRNEVRRYLEGLPVRARGDAWGYRVGKFVRRNRVATGLGVAAVAALLLGIAGTTTQMVRANRNARDATLQAGRANREADAARKVAEYLATVVESTAPYQFAGFQVGAFGVDRVPPERKEMLDEHAAVVMEELGRHPVLQARLLEGVGRAYVGLGLFREAEPLLATAMRLREEHLPEGEMAIADSAESLSWLRFIRGEFRDAEARCRQALAIRRARLGDDHEATDRAKYNLAVVLAFLERRLDESEQLFTEALQWREAHLGAEHTDTGYALLGLALAKAQHSASEAGRREALPMITRAAKIFGANEATQPMSAAISEVGQSIVHSVLGQEAESLAAAERGVAEARSMLGENHPVVDFVALLLANEMDRQGHRDEAVQLYENAVAGLGRRGMGESYFAARNIERLGMIRSPSEEGERHMREAMAIYEKVLGAESWRMGWCGGHLGMCLAGQGRVDEALSEMRAAREVFVKVKGEGRDYVSWIDREMARVKRRAGN